jgi:signal peptidase I
MTPVQKPPRKPFPDRDTRWERTKSNIRTIGGAILLAFFIRIVLFEAFEIEGPSMEPTLLNGDKVVVAKFSYGLFLPFAEDALFTWSSPSVGDVVIVKSQHDGVDIVKRVIGVAEDVIEIRDAIIYRNGEPLPHEDLGPCGNDSLHDHDVSDSCHWFEETIGDVTYRTSRAVESPTDNHPPLTVPPDTVYVMGDHRDRSNDSRFFGVVRTSRVKGRALAIYWSTGVNGCRGGRIFAAVE